MMDGLAATLQSKRVQMVLYRLKVAKFALIPTPSFKNIQRLKSKGMKSLMTTWLSVHNTAKCQSPLETCLSSQKSNGQILPFDLNQEYFLTKPIVKENVLETKTAKHTSKILCTIVMTKLPVRTTNTQPFGHAC